MYQRTLGQFSNALLTIDKAHTTTEGPGLHTMFRWVKPGLWSQPPHSLCLEYMLQISPKCRNLPYVAMNILLLLLG